MKHEIKAPIPESLAEDKQLATMCKALGHPARLAIMRRLLAEQGCVCGRIVEVMPLAQSTVSQHLKVLKQAGLVCGQVEGPATCYCVNHDQLRRFREGLAVLFGAEEK